MPQKKILIVDDEEPMRKALSVRFTKEGFAVTVCTTGQEALDRLAQDSFDAVLLDLILPGEKDGFKVLEEKAATKNKDTPVFVVTCLGQEQTIKRVKELGAVGCFVKAQASLKEIGDAIKKEIG